MEQDKRNIYLRVKNTVITKTMVLVIIGLLGIGSISVEAARAVDEIELFYGYYKDDKLLTVNTPSIKLSKDLFTSTSFSIKYTYETFEKDPPENVMDAVTGATSVSGGSGGGFEEVRHEVIAGITHRIGPNTLGAGYFYGNEDDFLSNAVTLSVSREFFDKNLTLSLFYGHSLDEVDDLNPPLGETFPKDKNTDTVTFSATQILSPKLLATGGYSYSHVDGFQSLPLRKIRIMFPGNTFQVFEERHPDIRDRNTVFLRFFRYFQSQTSADLNLSYYFDNWDVNAYSTELRLNQYLSDHILGRLRYRFYSQSEAHFYKPVYTQELPLMTADVRLRDFDTHTFGIKFTLGLEPLGIQPIRDWSISTLYDRYLETNDGLKAHIGQAHLNIPF